MPQIFCEIPEENQIFFIGSPVGLVDGRSDEGQLVRVVAELSVVAAAAGSQPPGGPNQTDATLDETRTRWSVMDMPGALQVGANFINLWAQFDGGLLTFQEARPITGMDNPMDGLPVAVPAPAPPQAAPPAPPHAAVPPMRAMAMAAPAVAAVAPAAAGVPPAFNVRLRRTQIAHLTAGTSVPVHLSTLLNSHLLQAEPIRLEFDFERSDWSKLVWSEVRGTVPPEDPESSSVWSLEIPIPPGLPWIARVYLRRETASGDHEDFWYKVGFDPSVEQSYASTTLGVHILKVLAVY